MKTPQDLVALPIAELTCHAKPMLLLDRAIAMDALTFETELSIRPDSLFCENGGVGAWIGIEYMAQTIAAFAGAEGLQAEKSLKVGFLVGTRQYHAQVPAFKVGMTLRVRVKKVLHNEDGLSVLECSIRDLSDDRLLAEASLTVVEVQDMAIFLKEKQA